MPPSSCGCVLLLTLVKAHLHGGSYDPNVVNVSLASENLSSAQYQQPPPPVSHQAHGGAYTPGSSVVVSIPFPWQRPNVSYHDMYQSYPNQPFTHPYQQQPVSPPTSPLSAQSGGYQVPVGQQQPIPLGQVQHQNTMQYQQQQQPIVCLSLAPNLLASLTVTVWWAAGCRLSATRTRQWTAGRNNGKALPWLLLRIGTN